MSYEKDLESKIRELKFIINRKNTTIEDLNKELRKSRDNLLSAEGRISSELEPRIQSERDSYDFWALSGGNDPCFAAGDSGNCGVDCSIFGDKPECTENMSDKELLEAYIINNGCESAILDRGLWLKKLKIDWQEDTENIKISIKVRLQRFISNFKDRK